MGSSYLQQGYPAVTNSLRFGPEISDFSYQKESTSQYSTNNTQMKESLQIQIPDEDMYPAKPNETTMNFRLAPTTPTRNRNMSPMGHTPVANSSFIARSPGLSPISRSPMLNKTNTFVSAHDLSAFPHLEAQGISMEELRQEKAITSELIKSAKSFGEISKLLKNAITLLKREAPGANNMVLQAISKSDMHRMEAEDCKRRLREVHLVTI